MFIKYSILVILFGWMSICSISQPEKKYFIADKKIASAIPPAIVFDKEVKPIFEKHCNPCHFPGGKMYDKLPFDQAATIINHEEGILRRIKEEGEVKTIKQFVSQQQAALTN